MQCHHKCECNPAPAVDLIDHPPHYTSHPSGVECITITEYLNFCIGNAWKYLWRADEKGSTMEDLKKSAWYIIREIARRHADSNQVDAFIPPSLDAAFRRVAQVETGHRGAAFASLFAAACHPNEVSHLEAAWVHIMAIVEDVEAASAKKEILV